MRPLIALHELRQSGLGREEPQWDERPRSWEMVVGVVTAVYPIDHPENGLGQTLVDIEYSHLLSPWRMVPLGSAFAHGETLPYIPNSRRRQPYEPKPRSQMEGAVYDVRPGTRVLVSFPSGDLRSPVVVGVLKFNRQGEGGFPRERQSVDRFGSNGKLLDMVEVSPVDSALAEYPRSVDVYNGTRIERDNRGNLHMQTTIDHVPVFPGHNRIPASSPPQGNIGLSTRGAVDGSVGITTGKHPVTGQTNARGNVRIETAEAQIGNLIARLRSDAGRLWASTRGSDDGRVYLEDKDRDYIACRANGNAEVHGEQKAVLDADDVRLGNENAPYEIVLWPQLNELMILLTSIFDAHVHSEVKEGDDESGPPTTFQEPTWLQRGAECKADHVKSVKTQSATPHFEADPDGETA